MKNKKYEFCQYFTSPLIAEFMAQLVFFENATTVLDPAVGKGILLKKLNEMSDKCLDYFAYDVDESMIKESKNNIDADVKYFNNDYLLEEIIIKPDIIISNPPYNKFQEIPNRKKYSKQFEEKYNFKISGYSNLCVYFLIKSLIELNENGRCAYIIPYEFLNTGYGNEIKKFFIKTGYLTTIYKFDSKLSLFDDVLTTSCILLFEKKQHEKVDFVFVEDIGEIKDKCFKKSKSFFYNELDYKEKWNVYFDFDEQINYKNLINFSEIARVKRGIATGGNAFFALSKDQINSLGLSPETLVKCICKSPDIKKMIFQENDFYALYYSNKKVHIFDGQQAINKKDFDYIRYGEENNYDKSYLNSHRSPWYLLEKKEIAPIWISVFNRSSFKVIRNETQSKNLTTFHGVYMGDNYNNTRYINIFYCYLLTPICRKILEKYKREYGDGLNKFEPNDLNNAKILDISLITEDDSLKILNLYNQIKTEESNSTQIIEKLNDIFISYMI